MNPLHFFFFEILFTKILFILRIGKRKRSEFEPEDEDEEAYFSLAPDEPSTPPISNDDDDSEQFGAGLHPLKSSSTEEDDDDEPIVPVRKKRKLFEIKSISYHKGMSKPNSPKKGTTPLQKEETISES